jgi:hypothetical protein
MCLHSYHVHYIHKGCQNHYVTTILPTEHDARLYQYVLYPRSVPVLCLVYLLGDPTFHYDAGPDRSLQIEACHLHIDADPDPENHFDSDPDPAYHFDTDLDPDPAYHLDTDPDPTFQFDADPDPAYHFYTDPDPTFQFDSDPDPACHLDSDPDPTLSI